MMYMVRTQIYLTLKEAAAIARMSKEYSQGKSALIRCAIDEFIKHREQKGRRKKLHAAFGMWENHKGLPSFDKMRSSFDRF